MSDETKTVTDESPEKEEAKLNARAAEAEEKPITFEHRGLSLTIPHPLDMPLEILMTDDEIEATQLMLGREQWAAYLETRPKVRDFSALVTAMSEAQGGDASGN